MMNTENQAFVAKVLREVFELQREEWKDKLTADEFERREHDFIFHMTDWAEDAVRFATWIQRPESMDQGSAETFVIGFLYHVIPHLTKAGQLLLGDITSPFENGSRDVSVP